MNDVRAYWRLDTYQYTIQQYFISNSHKVLADVLALTTIHLASLLAGGWWLVAAGWPEVFV